MWSPITAAEKRTLEALEYFSVNASVADASVEDIVGYTRISGEFIRRALEVLIANKLAAPSTQGPDQFLLTADGRAFMRHPHLVQARDLLVRGEGNSETALFPDGPDEKSL